MVFLLFKWFVKNKRNCFSCKSYDWGNSEGVVGPEIAIKNYTSRSTYLSKLSPVLIHFNMNREDYLIKCTPNLWKKKMWWPMMSLHGRDLWNWKWIFYGFRSWLVKFPPKNIWPKQFYVMSRDLTGSFRRGKFYRRYLQLLWRRLIYKLHIRTQNSKDQHHLVIRGKQFVNQR